jgi:hypothetical protein
MSLTVNSQNFSGSVTQQAYNFDVIIACAVTRLTITSKVSDTIYTLNQGTLLTDPFTVVQDAACEFVFTYSQTFIKDGSSISQPTWIAFNSATQTLSMSIINPADIGVYTITSTATIPQDDGNGVNRNISFSFTLTVIAPDPCKTASF